MNYYCKTDVKALSGRWKKWKIEIQLGKAPRWVHKSEPNLMRGSWKFLWAGFLGMLAAVFPIFRRLFRFPWAEGQAVVQFHRYVYALTAAFCLNQTVQVFFISFSVFIFFEKLETLLKQQPRAGREKRD